MSVCLSICGSVLLPSDLNKLPIPPLKTHYDNNTRLLRLSKFANQVTEKKKLQLLSISPRNSATMTPLRCRLLSTLLAAVLAPLLAPLLPPLLAPLLALLVAPLTRVRAPSQDSGSQSTSSSSSPGAS